MAENFPVNSLIIHTSQELERSLAAFCLICCRKKYKFYDIDCHLCQINEAIRLARHTIDYEIEEFTEKQDKKE